MTLLSAGTTLVRTYRMTDTEAQALLAGLLIGVTGLSVEVGEKDGRPCLVVGCGSIRQANSVDRYVMAVDPKAILAELTNRRPDGLAA